MLYEYNKLIQYAINLTHNDVIKSDFRRIADSCQEAGVEEKSENFILKNIKDSLKINDNDKEIHIKTKRDWQNCPHRTTDIRRPMEDP